MRPRAVLPILIVLAVAAASCSTQPLADTEPDQAEHDHADHEHPETGQLPEAEEGQQIYEVVDGRAGYRRRPFIDVSTVEFVDFSQSDAGRAFAPVAPADGILLLFFGYLSCPDVCPTTIFDYGEALELVPADVADRVSFGMISVDAERDAGPQIVDYVSLFIEGGLGLLPQDEEGLLAAAEAFGIRYEIEDHEEGSLQYAVGHSAIVFAIDDAGTIVWEFTYPTPATDISAALIELFEERY